MIVVIRSVSIIVGSTRLISILHLVVYLISILISIVILITLIILTILVAVISIRLIAIVLCPNFVLLVIATIYVIIVVIFLLFKLSLFLRTFDCATSSSNVVGTSFIGFNLAISSSIISLYAPSNCT